jgi:CheY-like chemotaxis protein
MKFSGRREATIFIVEDDDIDALTIERGLRRVHIVNTIVRAHDGQQALDMLKAGDVPEPYIVLLDLNLPKLSGLELLREIRDDPDLTSAVVFVLTTSQSDEDLTSAYRDHVAGYILKQHMATDFINVLGMIEHYWKVVELPVKQ